MSESFKLGLRGKTTITLAGLLFLSLGFVSLASYWQSLELAKQQVMALELSKFAILKHEIEVELSAHRNNLLSLHDLPSVDAIIRAQKHGEIDPVSGESLADLKEELTEIFKVFLVNHSQYFQIRYIGRMGNELVRVNRNSDGSVYATEEHQLQNKKEASYVTETMKLPEGAVYHSDVNLNREHGVIQVPNVPVLRLATPVQIADGNPDGLIIINLLTERLFSGVHSEANGLQRYIVDEKGYYIKHPDNSKTFGLDRGVNYRFQNVEPELAELARNSDQFIHHHETDRELDGFQKIYFSPEDKERYWLTTLHLPEEQVFSNVSKALNYMLLLSLTVGLISLIIVIWFVSKRIVSPVVNLAAAARGMREGNFSLRVDPAQTQDELRELYTAINDFAEEQQITTAKLEMEVQNQDVRLRAVIDNIVDGIITINERGLISGFNPAASRIFGYSIGDVYGENVKMLMPEPYHSEHDGYLHHHITTGEKQVIGIGREVVGQRKNGSTFPMELAVSEVMLDNQRHFVGIVRDITERKQAENEVKDYVDRLDLATRSMHLGIWEYNISSGDLIWDDNMFAIYGLRREDFSGAYNAWESALHPDDMERAAAALNDALAGGDAFDITFRVIWPSGEIRDIQAAAVIQNDAYGNVSRMVGMNWDITERKRIEQMQKEFVSTVSHELRTPLTSIRGSLGLILGGVTGELPEKAKALLTIANNNSERLIHLINDILDMEKITAGKMQFDYTVVNLTAVVQQAVESNKGYGDQLHVRFELISAPDEAVMVNVDEKRMAQVMSNLLSNAAKYSPTDDRVEISIAPSGKGIRISVHDHGKGIPEAFKSRIFSKFAQADSSDTRQKGGTGLGLNITKAIVEQHGGTIGFESGEGTGTTFFVDLPLWIKEAKSIEKASEVIGGPEKPLILIIEDDPDISKLISMFLANEGYDFHQAFSCEEATDLLSSHHYSAVTLDLNLPDGSGIALMQDIRHSNPERETPVVVVSANIKEQLRQSEDHGAVLDWIEKPIDETRLLKTIRTAAERKTGQKLSILHVEDDADIASIVDSMLLGEFDITHADTLKTGRQLLTTGAFDLLLLDIGLPDGSGLDLLPVVDELKEPPSVLIFSAQDVDPSVIGSVSGVLIKSKMDNEKLMQQIKAAISKRW